MEKIPRYWPFVRGIHRWSVNNLETGDLRRHRAHYDVTVMGRVSYGVNLKYLRCSTYGIVEYYELLSYIRPYFDGSRLYLIEQLNEIIAGLHKAYNLRHIMNYLCQELVTRVFTMYFMNRDINSPNKLWIQDDEILD